MNNKTVSTIELTAKRDPIAVADAVAVSYLSRPVDYPVAPGGQQVLSRSDLCDLYWKALKLMTAADAPTVDLEFRQMARLYAATFQQILRHSDIDHRDIEFGLAAEAYGNDDWHMLKALTRFQQYLLDREYRNRRLKLTGKHEAAEEARHGIEKANRAEKKIKALLDRPHIPAMPNDTEARPPTVESNEPTSGGAE